MVYDESSVPKGIDVEEVEIDKEKTRKMWDFLSYLLGSSNNTSAGDTNPEATGPSATNHEIQNATGTVTISEDEPRSPERQATFVQDIMNIISDDFDFKSEAVEQVSEAVVFPEEPTEKTPAKYARVKQPLARQKSIVDNMLEAASIVQDIIAEDFGPAEPVPEEQSDEIYVAESLKPLLPVQDPEEADVHQESFLNNIMDVAGIGQAADIDEPSSAVAEVQPVTRESNVFTTEHRTTNANEERSMEEKMTSMIMDDQFSTGDASPDSSHANSSGKLEMLQEAEDETKCANCIVCGRRGLSVHFSRRRAVTCDAHFPN